MALAHAASASPLRLELLVDQELVRAGLRALLEPMPVFCLAGQAADGAAGTACAPTADYCPKPSAGAWTALISRALPAQN